MGKIDIYKPHREDKYQEYEWASSRYYDYPDGEDLMGKLLFTTKTAFYVSSFFGLIYSNKYPAPPTVGGKLLRVAKFVVPGVGMAATFTCVTYYSTIFRKKDDPVNYAIGGAAAGLLLAPALGHPYVAFWGPFLCSIFGAAKKSAEMQGLKICPEIKRKYFSSYYNRNLDTSLFSDPVGGNWTKAPAK